MLANTLMLVGLASMTASPSTLSGRVTDEAGEPIAGANVSIYTAKPRDGVGTLCPSCYRDCAKSTTTDAMGEFTFANLDETLLFRVLVTAPDVRATVTEYVDPRDQNVATTLSRIPAGLPKSKILRGRIVEHNGEAVVGAIVVPFGAKTTSRRWWGRMPGVDAASVSDANGHFVVTSIEPKLGMDFKVYARGFATRISPLLDLDGESKMIKLDVGTDVTGRLMHDGKPVVGRAVGIVQTDRSAGSFVGETTLMTDDNGHFAFLNLQANDKYAVYTLCDVAPAVVSSQRLTMKAKRLETRRNGQTLDLGEIELVEGVSFSGRISLSDNEAIPDNSTLRLSRAPAWDWANVAIAKDGSFRAEALPPEIFKVYVHVEGFDIDNDKLSFQSVGRNAFGVNMKKNRSDVEIYLRKATSVQ